MKKTARLQLLALAGVLTVATAGLPGCSARSARREGDASRQVQQRPAGVAKEEAVAARGSLRGLEARGEYEAARPVPLAAPPPFMRARSDQPPAGFRSSTGEELWVIARAPASEAPATADQPTPELRARLPERSDEIPLPLEHTNVNAAVTAYIATVHVEQRYRNPYGEKIEAVYVFPLPQNAAVTEFLMVIGERRIRGIIREREEAERIYQEAKHQGYVASLLTQERPNIFTQSVANIEPGKAIEIDLTYFNTLAYHDGAYELAFPMVVGPRFNPPGSTDGVGAVARGAYGASGQATEVQYLRPSERSGHDISLTVDLEAGVTIESLESPTHAIHTEVLSSSRRRVRLSALDSVPNKDFVLRYKVAGETLKSAFLAHHDERGGFFTLMLQPPARLSSLTRSPMEMIFVLDCSGSMSGVPISLAKGVVERALRRLHPEDTFQIVRFSDRASQLGTRPLAATKENIERGIAHLRSLEGEGGTMMIEGIRAALGFPHDGRRLRVVSFLTDGYIGNEAEVLAEVHDLLGPARIFSFGVGSSTNRYLLEQLALFGKGAVAYVGLDEGTARAADGFYERVSHPALTDIAIDWGDLRVNDVYPRRIPDLFVGRPVVVTGRFAGHERTKITVSGRAGERVEEIVLDVDPSSAGSNHPAIASVWARSKIADLEESGMRENVFGIEGEIQEVALAYGLMSAYTAFVAVDSTARTEDTHGTSVSVPVPVPEGVRYDTSVQGDTGSPRMAR